MDSLISAAARALAVGDVLGALGHVALREDPPALALRGIAMARLGELPRARELLLRAERGFGRHESAARARCVVARAEVALALRELGTAPAALQDAAATLAARGDRANALQARLIALRRLLLLGRLDEATAAASALALDEALPPALLALAALAAAELAMRRLQPAEARSALQAARRHAARSRIAALEAEVETLALALDQPAARGGPAGRAASALRLDEVQALLASGRFVVDGCRHQLRRGEQVVSLARRPVLFALAQALADAAPGDADRATLIASAFRQRQPDETHRARLRVEIGRLRRLAAPLAAIETTPRGFAWRAPGEAGVGWLRPPIEGEAASLRALLADGRPWSTSALAIALGDHQRTVQRALAELEAAGQVRAIGGGRARRWLAPSPVGFTTILLLPALPSTG